MRPRLFALFCTFCLSAFLLAGCESSAEISPDADALPHSHRFPLKIDGVTVQARIALTHSEKMRGLMEVTEMPENEGMLFVDARPKQASFWMRNTLIPLDIGYFDSDGILLEIYRMYPRDESAVKSRSDQVQFALEMNQGWFSANNIRPGATLDFDALRQAISARGFSPKDYGL